MVAERTGTVLASYGRGVLVQAPGMTLHCALSGRKQRVVCGDRVVWAYPPSADGPTVQSVEPRRNVIERIDSRGRPEPVAANIDRLAVVVAPEPAPDWFLVDRYWAGAVLKNLSAVLVVNKRDLPTEDLHTELGTYRGLDMPCLEVAAHLGAGVAELRQALGHGVTLLVGQSGVGKSSLVNALIPDAEAQTAALTRDVEGRHTTTTARWYALGGRCGDHRRAGACATSRRRRALCGRLNAASSKSSRTGPRAVSRTADTWRNPVAQFAARRGAADFPTALRKLSAPVPAL